jgi:hypothetical protein
MGTWGDGRLCPACYRPRGGTCACKWNRAEAVEAVEVAAEAEADELDPPTGRYCRACGVYV